MIIPTIKLLMGCGLLRVITLHLHCTARTDMLCDFLGPTWSRSSQSTPSPDQCTANPPDQAASVRILLNWLHPLLNRMSILVAKRLVSKRSFPDKEGNRIGSTIRLGLIRSWCMVIRMFLCLIWLMVVGLVARWKLCSSFCRMLADWSS